MKAIYQKPETTVTAIATMSLLANSPVENGFKKSTSPEVGDGITSGNLSRQRSVWGDDEDYDF